MSLSFIPFRKEPAWKVEPAKVEGMYATAKAGELRWELYLGMVGDLKRVIPDEQTAVNTAACLAITIVQGISPAGWGGYMFDHSWGWEWQ